MASRSVAFVSTPEEGLELVQQPSKKLLPNRRLG
jgi:hypothetical protein